MTERGPRPDDAVLGGQNQAPMDAAVLGGIQGVRQKLALADESAKREGILQAPNYGEQGIAALFGVLEGEQNQRIWQLAYDTLENVAKGNEKLHSRSWWGKLWQKEVEDDKSEGLSKEIKDRLKNYLPWYEYESVTVNHRGEIIKRTPGRAKYYREDLGNGVNLDLVYIAGGTFLMGSPESEHKSYDHEKRQHQVMVPDFWLGKYSVTQAQWQAVMWNNPAEFKGENRPVGRVSWYEC